MRNLNMMYYFWSENLLLNNYTYLHLEYFLYLHK